MKVMAVFFSAASFSSASLDVPMFFRPCPCGNSSQILESFCVICYYMGWQQPFCFNCIIMCNVYQSSLTLTRSYWCLFNDLVSKSTSPEKLIMSAYEERTLFIFLFQARTQIVNILEVFLEVWLNTSTVSSLNYINPSLSSQLNFSFSMRTLDILLSYWKSIFSNNCLMLSKQSNIFLLLTRHTTSSLLLNEWTGITNQQAER